MIRVLVAAMCMALSSACGPSTPNGGFPGGDDGGPAASDLARGEDGPPAPLALKTVFLILMENHNWSDIKGSPSAPYLNSLLSLGAHAENYFNAPAIHPSEPNYLWLEAGTNFGVLNDSAPSTNHQSSTAHLTALLEKAGIPWRSYQQGISGTNCPLVAAGHYAPKHNPNVFFDDMTGNRNAADAHCIAHNRPMSDLAGDLAGHKVARYNFLTPDLCNDMHDVCPPVSNSIKQGDDWLAANVPAILASDAYKDGGAVFITWDESELGDHPIGMIVLAGTAKMGYASTTKFTHSSMLRTAQEIFGVTPLLGDAANATDLAELLGTSL